jgi:uncharacterized protein (TIGR03086 family)
MSEIAQRYRRRADDFERRVAAVQPGEWSSPSPCAAWDARGVVRHVIDMHGVMLRPFERELSPAASVEDDPLAALRAARADIEAILDDPSLASTAASTPTGTMTAADQIDQVVSEDMVIHGWDLAKATGQDTTIDASEVERMWAATQAMPADLVERSRTRGAFGPGIEVWGPEVPVPEDASLQDRLLGFFGREP